MFLLIRSTVRRSLVAIFSRVIDTHSLSHFRDLEPLLSLVREVDVIKVTEGTRQRNTFIVQRELNLAWIGQCR